MKDQPSKLLRTCRFYGNVDSTEEEGRNKRRFFQLMSVMPIIDTPDVVFAVIHGVSEANYITISHVRSRHTVGSVLTVVF